MLINILIIDLYEITGQSVSQFDACVHASRACHNFHHDLLLYKYLFTDASTRMVFIVQYLECF